ncbi:cytochrome c oxidase subunit IV [Coccidioides immitis RS]|uniref:Cytochrome c oxidase polypeptide V n=3 Tax=Coccidioides immitis TaxID=5501 RepID=A0A0J8QNA6_COCIT|nr:cytochrome c oxidase subunit IV [Coccidioides immitis RS]KMP03377.1 cytochrome c oxidase polypeptide V [Coccidioides immitis RMSCC 2394]KMU73919.1 cytochrome c oxidase polypeptide 5 [Coccidioides immitis RMSCC 3703]KMU84957.1 cytochrome c oxidase polypeptide V [Coccidioides immitis H538.4]TPX23694.1 Cytochrome c oxidase subunit 5A [Coccidioides immitis]EAS30797.3 cytochrome c oxidase subunit IV [Coccidioides immitis RS]
MYFRAASRSIAASARGAGSVRSSPSCLYARVSQTAQAAGITQQQTRAASSSEHAIANPTLAGIEKRWEAMPPQEQAELWMQLRDRMKVDWHEMTLQEKKAAYWIAFGPHGPRAETPKGEGMKVFIQVAKYMLISFGVFYAIRMAAGPAPKTMSKEWQEATNEYALKEKLEPITGISSAGYQGKGFIQSPPASKQ